MKQLIVIGNGGHSQVVQSIIKQSVDYQLNEVWDDGVRQERVENGITYKPIPLGVISPQANKRYFIAIGDNTIRKKIATRLKLPAQAYATVIHPRAIIDESAVIANGCLVMANAVVQTNSVIGKHSIINTSAVIEHDAIIGHFVHVGPQATLTGNCQLDNFSFIGAGSVLVPNTKIGQQTIVGAGSVVTRSLPSEVTAYGNPATIH